MRFWRWLQDENAAVSFLRLVGVATVGFLLLLVVAGVWFGFFGTG